MGKGLRVVLTLMAVTLAGCGGSQGQRDARAAAKVRAEQARVVAQQAGLGPDVQAFLARAAGASSLRYTVVYNQGAGQTTTVLADPPNRRIDVQGATGSDSLDRVLVKGTKSYVCHRGAGKWACQVGGTSGTTGPFTPDAIAQTIGSLVQLSDTYDFSVSGRRLLGLDASCLTADRKPARPSTPQLGDHASLCIAPNGVILRLEGSGAPLAAVSYRPSVSGGAFDLPAKPSPPPTA